MSSDYIKAEQLIAELAKLGNAEEEPLYGGITCMPVMCLGVLRFIDKRVYMNACGHNSTDNIFSINPCIDKIQYPSAVSQCIKFIYCAGVTDFTEIKHKQRALLLTDIDNLPEYLAIIKWCSINITRPSAAYSEYQKSIVSLIRRAVSVVQALTDNFNAQGLCARINILMKKTNIHTILNLPLAFTCNKGQIGREDFICSCYDEAQEDTDRHKYIWNLYVKMLNINYPSYLKIPGFGEECAELVQKLLAKYNYNIQLTSQHTICDVFIGGITIVL